MSKSRFHFEIFWPKFPDFEQVITDAWRLPAGTRGPFLRLDDLLRGLVKELQRWAATKIGGIRDQLLMARALIQQLDWAQELRPLTGAEGELRKRMKLRCLGLSSLERTMAR